jgi:glucose-6-phosphate isomerase
MAQYMMPFSRQIDLKAGHIPGAPQVLERRLSDLRGLFADGEAEQALSAENPLIYEVYEATENPKVAGQLLYSTTIIYPGKVGREYFMTKGHYHALRDRAELYYGLLGEGALLLQAPDGRVELLPMRPGTAAYVPPYWGHRTMNTGTENFVFLAVYPGDAGYDYGTIADEGFASILVEQHGKPELISNPRFHAE